MRPGIITFAVIMGMIGAVILLVGAISYMGQTGLEGGIILYTIVQIAIFIGLWNMKKWALIGYTISFVIGIFINLAYGGGLFGILIPLLVVISGWKNVEEMS